jgi:uncharacterized protein
LLRIIAVVHSPDQFEAVPDPTRTRPGRGAHLHPVQACLEQAQRRRAFARSLRVTGVVDIGELVETVDAATTGTVGGGTSSPARTRKVGRPT